ncbi:hypothetical protein VR7878_00389 [Vibrio ruber DSM 16370]|uniref:DUF262 domain-containing protein n=1 Tax=Vibrio ruber (strain DSM 16370 / JCM 11486 / BCRC 17186 / CECT 7878 / LMG 23124 / VR1) TaxID=1123498 RepID=A0A1R4LAJ2_VIBR1|nr:DUF262 domain-containing protein [Vibrio ruber]SJN53576.1 hypothetical protein VR7878_00389 [Vibrio ruber DSM 16370]
MSNQSNEHIVEFSVQQLLGDAANYLIPMYQRNYAWGEREINQLVQDVTDYQSLIKNPRYYIGTLIVYRRTDGVFEVIDGQQRFTTLSLMALYLSHQKRNDEFVLVKQLNLTFESRPKSQATLKGLLQGIQPHLLVGDEYNESLVRGYILIGRALERLSIKLEDFVYYLFHRINIIRVEVPQGTDLNHYFEVMNNRGEQLEKHEILKAKLLSVLNQIKNERDRTRSIQVLHKVWEACANMERYVQYGFSVEERNRFFGHENWGQFTVTNFDGLMNGLDEKEYAENTSSLFDIINQNQNFSEETATNEYESPDRFHSVIDFSNLLLHVLRVYTQEDIALDDKQLINQFDHHLLKKTQTVKQVKKFIFALLKCKYLFDQFVIKREFTQRKDNWSLKKLKYYSPEKKRFTVSFVNSFDDNDNDYAGINREVLMLLAAFHVSTPTSVYKHWLNAALYFLYYDQNNSAEDYLKYLMNIAKRFVFERFLAPGVGEDYYHMLYDRYDEDVPKNRKLKDIATEKLCYGQIESNFVFNFLDYLLWLGGKESSSKIKEFEFTFRSSVEHFYPQHPIGEFSKLDSEHLNSFGNLCLISHSKNSRLSNFQPNSKLEYFEKQKEIDSLKLYHMINLTKKNNGWTETEIQQHGEEMVDILLHSTQE